MRRRLKALKRLGLVYELVEEINSAEARMAAFEVGEAENAIFAEQQATMNAREREREAIENEDGVNRSAMGVKEEIAGRKIQHLKPILERRQAISDAAKKRHLASRLWNEQMKSLIEDEAGRVNLLEEKRLQVLSDDRFLGQRKKRAKEMRKR